MSDEKIPQAVRLYSRPDVAAHFLGIESVHSRLVWLLTLSHTDWTGSRPAWPTDETLMSETGIGDARDLRRALTDLRRRGLLESPHGKLPPTASRGYGRMLVPALARPVKLRRPKREDLARLHALCRSKRKRPGELVLAALGAYALACETAGDFIDRATSIGCSHGDLRRLIGAKKGAAWRVRIRELVELGVLKREGRDLRVTPPRTWCPSTRAMEVRAEPTAAVVKMPARPWLPTPPRFGRISDPVAEEPPGWWAVGPPIDVLVEDADALAVEQRNTSPPPWLATA